MSEGVRSLTQALADYLEDWGTAVQPAWDTGARDALQGPRAVLSLRGCRVEPAGFQDYLGERYREDTGAWEEVYGREAHITFGLDVYAPEGTESQAIQQLLDQLSSALLAGGPEGMDVEEFSWEELTFDTAQRMLKQPAQVICRAYLCAGKQPDGLFTDFELRGGLKQ